ncbi:hypothetical protein EEB15_16240 [Ramlibacter sp. WS9]|nr:hypothetical protein EEB15_16240 [Ramlibacter sp. WS9]
MEMSIEQAGALVDLRYVAGFLGQPLDSVRRWIHQPPPGFPPVVRIGVKITIRKRQLESWASGEFFAAPVVVEEVEVAPASKARRRGRPRKVPK